MTAATVTSKGQVTIPKEIREYLKLEAGTKVDFVIDENGIVKMIPLNVPVQNLSGILHREGMKAVSLSEMEEAIVTGATDDDWD